MIVPLKRWLNRMKFILMFILLTYALYHFLDYVTAWIEPNKYRAPEGRAVKVFQQEEPLGAETDSVAERLRIFYWYGE